MANAPPLRASVILYVKQSHLLVSPVKFIFCGLSQFLQNMEDFALHLAWCLINHVCDFGYCNNSLEECVCVGGIVQQNKNRT